ncbi:MAG TPA: hypothetical protein VGH87_22545 [Polyangiaceae bacterium]|jgi:hypothetical protein|nr:hypothetical protein [Polyangiaceae bacterium]
MRRARAIAFAVALALVPTKPARADLVQTFTVSPFGVPAAMAALQTVEPTHFIYMPVLGPWIDIGRDRNAATSALILDGVCQDLVAMTFLSVVVTLRAPPVALRLGWRVVPWFPQSGGGGLSVKAVF